jgi:carbon monoxide dehydrogenase subunit G
MTDETPRIEVTIAAPVEAVWRALREPQQSGTGTAGTTLDSRPRFS